MSVTEPQPPTVLCVVHAGIYQHSLLPPYLAGPEDTTQVGYRSALLMPKAYCATACPKMYVPPDALCRDTPMGRHRNDLGGQWSPQLLGKKLSEHSDIQTPSADYTSALHKTACLSGVRLGARSHLPWYCGGIFGGRVPRESGRKKCLGSTTDGPRSCSSESYNGMFWDEVHFPQYSSAG
jgi:hypothetical protein